MTGEDLPKAKVRRRRLFRLIWVVPVVALAVAAYLVFQRIRDLGPQISIRFNDGAGLRVGQTPLKYRGVVIGEVTKIGLTEDHQQVLVRARLLRQASQFASEGAVFWIVRPQLAWGNVQGLGTVLSGPEIQVLPGKGDEPKREFAGLDQAAVGMETAGLRVILRAERPKVRANSPVLYRGVEVGIVQKLDLAPNAASADVHVLIFQRFAPLVREGSTFWDSSGASFEAGLAKGFKFELDSMRALVTGAIEFATPPNTARAKPGSVFLLHSEAKTEWLAWTPRIPLGK
jgi:paraquat-inducible protein B